MAQLRQELAELARRVNPGEINGQLWEAKLREGKLTRSENPEDHVCVCLFAYDQDMGTLLLGRHRLSGLWSVPGGHVESEDETLFRALAREIREEMGVEIDQRSVGDPQLLVVVDNVTPSYPCKRHFTLCYATEVRLTQGALDLDKMRQEFSEVLWAPIDNLAVYLGKYGEQVRGVLK